MTYTVNNSFHSSSSVSSSYSQRIKDAKRPSTGGISSSGRNFLHLTESQVNAPKLPTNLPPLNLTITGSVSSLRAKGKKTRKSLTYEQQTTGSILEGLADPSKTKQASGSPPLSPELIQKRQSMQKEEQASPSNAPSTEPMETDKLVKSLKSEEKTTSPSSEPNELEVMRKVHLIKYRGLVGPDNSVEQKSVEQKIDPNSTHISSENSSIDPTGLHTPENIKVDVEPHSIQVKANGSAPMPPKLNEGNGKVTVKTSVEKRDPTSSAPLSSNYSSSAKSVGEPPQLRRSTASRFDESRVKNSAIQSRSSMLIMGLIAGLLGSLAMTGGGAALLSLFKAALKDEVNTEEIESTQEIASEELSNEMSSAVWMPSNEDIETRANELIEAARSEFEAKLNGESLPDSEYKFSKEDLDFFGIGNDPVTQEAAIIDSDACKAYFEQQAALQLYLEHDPTLDVSPSSEALQNTREQLKEAFKENPTDPVLGVLFGLLENGEIEEAHECVDPFVKVTAQLELIKAQINRTNETTSTSDSDAISSEHTLKSESFEDTHHAQLLRAVETSGIIFTTLGSVGTIVFGSLLAKAMRNPKLKA